MRQPLDGEPRLDGRSAARLGGTTAFYPVPSCLYFESQFMTDSLAIRVAMVLILVTFSVQSKICKIDIIKY